MIRFIDGIWVRYPSLAINIFVSWNVYWLIYHIITIDISISMLGFFKTIFEHQQKTPLPLWWHQRKILSLLHFQDHSQPGMPRGICHHQRHTSRAKNHRWRHSWQSQSHHPHKKCLHEFHLLHKIWFITTFIGTIQFEPYFPWEQSWLILSCPSHWHSPMGQSTSGSSLVQAHSEVRECLILIISF